MTTELVAFEDWTGGDEARARPAKNRPTQFRAINAWVYPSGGIGPRPPFQDAGITGLPVAGIATFNVLRDSSGTRKFIWAFKGAPSSVYRSAAAFASAATAAGTLTYEPRKGIITGNYIDWVSSTGYGGHIDATTSAADKTATPTGSDITLYGEFQVIARSILTQGLIDWSEAHNTSVWPPANDVEVGFGQSVSAIYAQRNSLVVCTRWGDVWAFTGVLGVNETLRKVDMGVAHPDIVQSQGAVLSQSGIWWVGGRVMCNFDGAGINYLPRPDLPLISGFDVKPWSTHPGHVLPLQDQDEFLLVGTYDGVSDATLKTVWVQAHRPTIDQWTRHSVPVTAFHHDASSVATAEAVKVHPEFSQGGVAHICTNGKTAQQAPKVYVFNSQQEYPHIATGTTVGEMVSNTLNDGGSGAPVVAEFKTSEHWDDQGRQLRVQTVHVDYSYDPSITALATYSKFDISVEALQKFGDTLVTRSSVVTFVPPASGSSPDGAPFVRGQVRFQFGDQGDGTGFRVRLDDWRGIVVHRIGVVLDAGSVVL